MAVMIGIDPNKRSHTAVALDGRDVVLDQLRGDGTSPAARPVACVRQAVA